MELLVQLSQLLQEARVRTDVPVGAHGSDGLRQRHALVDHQVGQDQGGRAAQTHGAVDEHLTWRVGGTQELTLELNVWITAANFIPPSNLLPRRGLTAVPIAERSTSDSRVKVFNNVATNVSTRGNPRFPYRPPTTPQD